MNPVTVETIVGAATVVLSVVGASFAAGIRIGAIDSTLHTISERLTRIEALFELRLKGRDDK